MYIIYDFSRIFEIKKIEIKFVHLAYFYYWIFNVSNFVITYIINSLVTFILTILNLCCTIKWYTQHLIYSILINQYTSNTNITWKCKHFPELLCINTHSTNIFELSNGPHFLKIELKSFLNKIIIKGILFFEKRLKLLEEVEREANQTLPWHKNLRNVQVLKAISSG